MIEPTDLDELTRRTRRLEFEDGLQDLHVGFVFLLLGLLCGFLLSSAGITFYVRSLVLNRELTILAGLALIPVFVLLTYGPRRLIEWIRRRWTRPGLGQAVPLRVQADWRYTLLATAAWLGLSYAGLLAPPRTGSPMDDILRPMTAAAGVATGIVYIGLGSSLRLRRYHRIGALGALLSAGLAFLPWTFSTTWLGLACLWAALLGVSGTWALRRTLADRGDAHG